MVVSRWKTGGRAGVVRGQLNNCRKVLDGFQTNRIVVNVEEPRSESQRGTVRYDTPERHGLSIKASPVATGEFDRDGGEHGSGHCPEQSRDENPWARLRETLREVAGRSHDRAHGSHDDSERTLRRSIANAALQSRRPATTRGRREASLREAKRFACGTTLFRNETYKRRLETGRRVGWNARRSRSTRACVGIWTRLSARACTA